MKWISVAFMVVMCAALVVLMSCSAAQVEQGANSVKEVAQAAAPMLPPPFGVIAGIVAGAAGLVATLAAGKAKGQAVAAGKDPHPVADFISSHSWLMPAITTLVGVANSRGWIHISPTEFTTLAASLGIATVGNVFADGHAEAQAPAPAK